MILGTLSERSKVIGGGGGVNFVLGGGHELLLSDRLPPPVSRYGN